MMTRLLLMLLAASFTPACGTNPERTQNLKDTRVEPSETDPKPSSGSVPPTNNKPDETHEAKDNREPDERRKKGLAALKQIENLDRQANEATPGSDEGDASGDDFGTAAATYAIRLNLEIARAWEVPKSLESSERKRLSGQISVSVKLSDEGYLTSYQFTQKSDNSQYNDSVERTLKQFQISTGDRKLPLPEHPEVREAVLEHGINLTSWEHTGH